MKRKEIIEELKKYFDIKELVCKHTYEKWGERAWQFLDTEILHTTLILRRDILKVPLLCNTSSANQRGLRCNICPEVLKYTNAGKNYLSAHINGAGFDFISSNMTAEEMRKLIKKNADLLPYPVRVEKDVTWLHIDCYDDDSDKKVSEF